MRLGRHVRLVLAPLAILGLVTGVAPARARAEPGDFRLVQGRIVIWPPARSGEPRASGVAVVQDAGGRRFFVEFMEDTAMSRGLHEGEAVTIVGRESFEPNQITAETIEPRSLPRVGAAAVPRGRQELRGRIEAASGSTAVLRAKDGRDIALDLSLLGKDRQRLTPGSEVDVSGFYVGPNLVVSRRVALVNMEEPAALAPGSAHATTPRS